MLGRGHTERRCLDRPTFTSALEGTRQIKVFQVPDLILVQALVLARSALLSRGFRV
jgi:hypothetical protein